MTQHQFMFYSHIHYINQHHGHHRDLFWRQLHERFIKEVSGTHVGWALSSLFASSQPWSPFPTSFRQLDDVPLILSQLTLMWLNLMKLLLLIRYTTNQLIMIRLDRRLSCYQPVFFNDKSYATHITYDLCFIYYYIYSIEYLYIYVIFYFCVQNKG